MTSVLATISKQTRRFVFKTCLLLDKFSVSNKSRSDGYVQLNVQKCRLVSRGHENEPTRPQLHTSHFLENISNKNLEGLLKYSCLLLNIPEDNFELFDRYKFIWDSAHVKIAVDGSANALAKHNLIHTADIVCGDFDSLDQRLLTRLRQKASANLLKKVPRVIETPNQNATDFTKALNLAMSVQQHDINSFIALYYSDGSRVDHIFGLINTLHQKNINRRKVYLINVKCGTISWLMLPGKNLIHKQPGREFCSLVPFCGPAIVTSTGLEYDMKASLLSFKGNLSICNLTQKDSTTICIETDNVLLFSLETKC